MIKRYTKLTPRILEHILMWGDIVSRHKVWTKSDTRVYALVKKEAKRLHLEYHQERKKIEINPSLDPKQPYYTT